MLKNFRVNVFGVQPLSIKRQLKSEHNAFNYENLRRGSKQILQVQWFVLKHPPSKGLHFNHLRCGLSALFVKW